MKIDILSGRTKGFFPVSIGTSIALESLFNLETENHKKVKDSPYKRYDCVCINLATLVRNIANSVKSNELKEVTEQEILTVLNNEIVIIKQIFQEYGKNRIICCFYRNEYNGVERYLKDALFKKEMTANQMVQYTLERRVPMLLKATDDILLETSQLFISHGKRNNLLLTHVAMDLIFNTLTSVSLLESHTGRIKTPSEFNTKLKNSPEYMPFNKISLQVYGDKGGVILPMPSKIRSLFTKEASELGVNPSMDLKRFVDKMKKSKEIEVRNLISRLK